MTRLHINHKLCKINNQNQNFEDMSFLRVIMFFMSLRNRDKYESIILINQSVPLSYFLSQSNVEHYNEEYIYFLISNL